MVTFRAQIRRAWAWGAAVIAGMVVLPSAFFPDGAVTDAVILLGLLVGLVLIVGLGVARPLHRWVWFRVLQPSDLGRRFRADLLQNAALGPVLQRWLHLTPQGDDRDTAG